MICRDDSFLSSTWSTRTILFTSFVVSEAPLPEGDDFNDFNNNVKNVVVSNGKEIKMIEIVHAGMQHGLKSYMCNDVRHQHL